MRKRATYRDLLMIQEHASITEFKRKPVDLLVLLRINKLVFSRVVVHQVLFISSATESSE